MIQHIKINKFLSSMTIESKCDCGKTTIREVSDSYNLFELSKNKSCGCMREGSNGRTQK